MADKFTIAITDEAEEELKHIKRFYREKISATMQRQLTHEPKRETRNKKEIVDEEPPWEGETPFWELRVGEYRVFYDVSDAERIVTIRAVRRKPPHATTEDTLCDL